MYLIIDIMPGGDLRYHFAKHRKFTEEQTSIVKQPFFIIIFRVFYGMHVTVFRIFTWKKYFAQGH